MTISEVLDLLDKKGIKYQFKGNESAQISGFSSLNNYKPGSFTWIKNQDRIPEGFNMAITSLVVASDFFDDVPNTIKVQQPKAVFFLLIEEFYGDKKENGSFVGNNTFISDSVKLGRDVRIGHNCSIDGDITIGDGTVIENNVSIMGRVDIGRRCHIQSGVVIGHESVSYSEDPDGVKTLIRQYGGVRIGDNVRIQSLCNIARGSIDDTLIMDDSIIGDGSEIAHNCIIGKNVAILPNGILCGSVEVGDNTYISGAYIKNRIRIGKNAYIGFGSVVVKDVADGEEVWGFPARKIPINRE